ncbi:MAG: PH domain-containing protein [Bacteroidales bacterium]|nr:PH domain-containing protein [Bacteroidales bacterium]
MGLFNAILGNASSIDIDDITKKLEPVLFPGEKVENAFSVIRDKWVFTDKRLIMVEVQGVTGKKKDYHSIPYKSIVRFSVETNGTFDLDCEMKIWVRSMHEPFEKKFGKSVDVCSIQRMLAYHVLCE